MVVVTTASVGYNLATNGSAPRPSDLNMVRAGGFDTRFRTWGASGSPIVLVPGAVETADTFAGLGAVLGRDHRVFAIDLIGTGYSTPSSPYTAAHMAEQVLAFLQAEGLTGRDVPVLVGHSSGAAVVGLAALREPGRVKGVVFLDGDALPLPVPTFIGRLVVNPYRTTILRLGVGSSWLVKRIYDANCGPSCPPLNRAGLKSWQRPLQRPGFEAAMAYTLKHGIPSMSDAELSRLKAIPIPKGVIVGAEDPQMSAADEKATAARIGAPPPATVPGRHLTMISSAEPVATAIGNLISRPQS